MDRRCRLKAAFLKQGHQVVKSIIQITPLREVDVLRTLKRMREKGLIDLKDPVVAPA